MEGNKSAFNLSIRPTHSGLILVKADVEQLAIVGICPEPLSDVSGLSRLRLLHTTHAPSFPTNRN
jgi:hypothetical protein